MEPPVEEPQVSVSETSEELQLLVSEMRDELSAYRWREAVWISVVLHVVFFLTLVFAPKWIPVRAILLPIQPKEQDATFLALPSDMQRVKPPKTDIISDKDRIAQARSPQPNKDLLRKLIDARRPGPPKPAAAEAQPAPSQQLAQATTPQPQAAPQQQEQTTRAQTPPAPSPFKIPSASSSVNQAIESVANSQPPGGSVGFGGGGEYGSHPSRPHTENRGAVDILSDTLGVDFGPYLKRLSVDVQSHWDPLIPEIARPPMMKKGVVVIEFAILKDGRVTGMKLVSSSGDLALDRAAWGAITSAVPLPQLPESFSGDYLLLRARFYYNPDRGEFE